MIIILVVVVAPCKILQKQQNPMANMCIIGIFYLVFFIRCLFHDCGGGGGGGRGGDEDRSGIMHFFGK